MSAIFVTATGTDVGKTYVTCAIIRALRSRGVAVSALKPVISGFEMTAAATSDTGRILNALGRRSNAAAIAAISPWRYAASLSVDMAAAREGRPVPFDMVASFCAEEAKRTAGVCLIEGVGGLMSPIEEQRTNLDLIATLRVPLLLVVGSYLGTISHTLTALAALDLVEVNALAVVISQSEVSPVSLDELKASLARFTALPVVAIGRGEEAPAALLDLISPQGLISIGVPTETRP
jgi:dethiobiotin synthetase